MLLLKKCRHIATPGALKPDSSTPAESTGFDGRDILISGNRIEKIAKDITPAGASGSECEIIDCSNLIVVPGFVNTHHHFYQTLTRNLPAVQNVKLFDWLLYLYDVWKNIDEEAVFYSSMVAIGELLKTGCSCTADHHYLYPHGFGGDLMGIQLEAADTLGIRFSPCRGSMSLGRKDGGLPPDSVVQTSDEIIEDSRRVVEKYHDPSELSMRRVILAPCSPFSITEELMGRSVRLARSFEVKLHTHLAETADEDVYCMKQYGRRPLRLMIDNDFIGPDVSLAHGIFFTDEELEILAGSGTSIVHCPSSNMRLGSGIARVKKMREMGINVALGVDGSASNDSSDFLGEMRNALLLQRVKYGPDALTARQVYEMATENGARLLGFDRIGRIEEGWAADLALFNINTLSYAGSLTDPCAALLFAGSSHQTEYTIVNGRVVVREGALTGYDEGRIVEHANTIASRILNP